MSSATFTWQNARGFILSAQDWRPANPPRGVVSLVHGLGEHIGRYQHVADALNAAGFGLVGVDLPGFGRSEGPRGHSSYDEIAGVIDCLLSETASRYRNIPHFLYGHSMGGGIVLYYTLLRRPPLKGVVATSPGLEPGTPVPAGKIRLAKVMSRVLPSFTMDNGLDVDNLSHDTAVIRTYKEDSLVHPRVSVCLGSDLLTKGAWILENAPQFPLPLLLVQGSGDHVVSPQATAAFARAVPQNLLTYKVWEGQFHETHNEPEKQQVLQYMIDWLTARL